MIQYLSLFFLEKLLKYSVAASSRVLIQMGQSENLYLYFLE